MITADEMAVVDANAAALGVPRKQLMESSGNAVARVVREIAPADARVRIVCGRGNNGGDAMVAARFLGDFDTRISLLGRAETITTEIARENWTALQRGGFDTERVTDSKEFELAAPDVIIDGMLGTGMTGALREPESTIAERVNDADATVLAVDVPSGVDADTGKSAGVAVDADHVVTFHRTKPGLSNLDCPVTVADIGIPAAAERFVERGDLLRLSRDTTAHKGDYGEVLVVGGGPYTGAPALAAEAAFRAGADLVRVACPQPVAREIQGYSKDLIVREFDADRFEPGVVDRVQRLATDHDVVVIGPGLGRADVTLDAVEEFLLEYAGTAVVDADALQVVADVGTDATLLCTPHQGEFRQMGGQTSDDPDERAEYVEAFAANLGHTFLLKGATDVVSDGKRTRLNHTGNPGMTVGGTGDVLAGACGALACRLDLPAAAAVAAYATGRAGDQVVDRQGYGLTATDLVSELPRAFRYEEAP